MRQNQQRTLDAFGRVQDFLVTYDVVLGPLTTSEGSKQLDAALVALARIGNDQGTADLRMVGQKKRELALTVELRAQHMIPIATFARARLRGAPDFAALTKSTGKLERAHLVRAARAMATAAAVHVDALVRGGFPADTITQLGASADALNAALVDRANTKVGRVGATKGIEQGIQSGREAVTMLHAVISKQYASDPTFLAAWNAARRVTSKPGSVRVVAAAPAAAAVVSAPPAAAAVVAAPSAATT